MKVKQTPIASAVALVLMGMAYQPTLQAQPSTQQEKASANKDDAADSKEMDAKEMEVVLVTGIRASLEKSLSVKRDSDAVVEVITSEDVGKMPDKNIADSLQRLPGVTISSASASEGGFDENDRVSLRGTNPSLTQTMINGHMIGSGDWFVLNQVGTVGRSVSYSLLPSELVGQVIVRKSAQADTVEGGVAGTVDIRTRKPLQFHNAFTAEASVGAVYASLPDEIDPQFSGLVNWKNEADSFGVLVQVFSEERSLRRDGQEMLGYSQIAANSSIAASNPDLAGVYYPNAIGSALFEQQRERKGGLIDIQGRPSDSLTIGLSAFSSHMEATNYNRNFIVWPSRILGGGGAQLAQAPDPGYVVRNNTLVEARFSNIGDAANRHQYAIDDQIYRPGANSESEFINLDIEFLATDRLTLNGKIGSSSGRGETPEQAVFEGDIFNTGATYRLNGLGAPADASIPLGNPAVFTGTTLDWIFGANPATTDDKERWAQLDGEFSLDDDHFRNIKFGLRAAKHERDSTFVAQGPLFSADPFNVANLPRWNGETYPGDFGDGLGGGNFPRNVWQIDPHVLRDWANTYANRDPITRRYFPAEFAMEENNRAAYIMSDFSGDNWSGNLGVRIVQTEESVLQNVPIPSSVCAALAPCPGVPNAITTSAFGSFYQRRVNNDYTDVLPSANVRFQLSDHLVGRLAAAKTMARPDFSSIGGAVDLNDTLRTGSGGNPNLKPIRSTNFDAALEWYYGPESLLSAGLFYMDLSSYVSYGVSSATYRNIRTGLDEVYSITSPVNGKGDIKGFELAWQQPLAYGFGVMANYTYADAAARKEVPTDTGELVGASRDTYNLAGYFENDWLNARVAYTYRSEFFNGLDRSSAQHQDEVGTLAASLGFKITDKLSVSLDGLNLNTPVLKYYANNRDQPTAFYDNGRQFYLSLRMKF